MYSDIILYELHHRDFSIDPNSGIEHKGKFDQRNTKLYESYKALADRDRKVIFGGRLGEYRYYDMDKVIESALKLTL